MKLFASLRVTTTRAKNGFTVACIFSKHTGEDCFALVLQQFESEGGGGTEVPLGEGKKEGEARSACGNALLLPSSCPPFLRY